MTGSLLIVRSGRHPVVVGVLVGLLLIGLFSLVFDPPSKTIDLAFDYPQRALWSAQVAFASSVTLAGLWWRDPITGLLIERIGWALVTVGLSTYLVILATVSTLSAAGAIVGIASGIIVGAVGRIVAIRRDLAEVRHA